jgi:tetratricopeptide (TPR) repeat protein
LQRRNGGRPFFAWLHFFDPHEPYEPHPRFLEQAAGDAYLGEVAAMDHAIGLFLDALRDEGLLSRTVLLVVADHGEGLGEHGEPTHGTHCYETTLRVPLLLRLPDGSRAGERSPAVVSVVDVFPTLLDSMRLRAQDVDGESLTRADESADRGVYFESYYGFVHFGWSPVAGWMDRRAKYVHSSRPQAFDPLRDPGETDDLLLGDSLDTERYRDAIRAVAAGSRLTHERLEIDEELLDKLRSLGYATGGDTRESLPHPLEETGRASPADSADELLHWQAGMRYARDGRRAQAIATMRAILARNPHNMSAYQELGSNLLQSGRCEEAVAVYREMFDRGMERAMSHKNVGQCLEALGDPEAALAHYRRAQALDPRHEVGSAEAARLERDTGM